MVNVAINGFGRIGRLFFRAGFEKLNIIAINDLGDINTLKHLLKYDSVHGRFKGEVKIQDNSLIVNGKKVIILSEKDPTKLPWAQLGVDIVAECTGVFRTQEKASMHITAGAKKVILSAPGKGGNIKSLVMGVNDEIYDKETDHVVDNASCTTNCLAPVVKVLNDNYGIKRGFMTTIHSYTADQRIVDLPHSDLRRARTAAVNMIPTSTGAAIAVGRVIPEIEGKMEGMAVRVPTPDGSMVDLTVELEKDATAEDINKLFENVSNHHLSGILEYTDDPIVSTDIVGNPHSSIFDSSLTKVIGGNMVHIVAWYDNEWGYSNRLVDMASKLL